jgi:hypothetical protein
VAEPGEEGVGVGDVELVDGEVGHQDLVTLLLQVRDEVVADEPSGTGDE